MQAFLRRLRHIAAASLVLLATVLLWSSVRPEFSPPSAFQMDKAAHAGAFALMSLLASLAFPYRRHLIACLLALAALGGLIELAQIAAPGRSGSFADWLVDLLGLGMGIAIASAPPLRRRLGMART